MITDELKPCPFCGGESFIRADESHSTAFFVGCSDWDCFGNMMWDETEAEARRKWNTRAESAEVTAIREQNARMVEALRFYAGSIRVAAGNDGGWRAAEVLAEIEKEAGDAP